MDLLQLIGRKAVVQSLKQQEASAKVRAIAAPTSLTGFDSTRFDVQMMKNWWENGRRRHDKRHIEARGCLRLL
jgi:hypothetical protein